MPENMKRFLLPRRDRKTEEEREIQPDNTAEERGAMPAEGEIPADNPFIAAEESEEYKRMEREFRDYRRRKVLARIDSLVTGDRPAGDIREELKEIARDSARAVVLPRFIAAAKKELPSTVRIETLVDFPFAAGGKKAVSREIKGALHNKTAVGVGVNLSAYAGGNYKPCERELRALKRLARNAKVTPVFNVAFLSLEQQTRLANSVKANKFGGVKLVAEDVKATADAVKLFDTILGQQCPVEVVGNISTAEEAEELFVAGADRIVTMDYRTLSRGKLDGVSVL